MRKTTVLIPLALCLFLTACGPVDFLNSCFSNEVATVEPALAGTWNGQDGGSTVSFRPTDDGYDLLITERRGDSGEPDQTRYHARLAQLGGSLYLDLLADVAQANPGSYPFVAAGLQDQTGFEPRLAQVGDGLYASLVPSVPAVENGQGAAAVEVHLVQAHRVYRVVVDGDALSLTDLSDDWLKAALDSGQFDLGHEIVGDSVVVTAPTREVEHFLAEVAGLQAAFPQDSTTEFRR